MPQLATISNMILTLRRCTVRTRYTCAGPYNTRTRMVVNRTEMDGILLVPHELVAELATRRYSTAIMNANAHPGCSREYLGVIRVRLHWVNREGAPFRVT